MSLSQDIARIKQRFIRGEDWGDLLEEFELRYKSHPFVPVVKKLKELAPSLSPAQIFKSLRKFYRAYIRSLLGEDISPYQEFIGALGISPSVKVSTQEAESSPGESGGVEAPGEEAFEEISFEKIVTAEGEREERGYPGSESIYEPGDESTQEAEPERSEQKADEYIPLWKREFVKKKTKFVVLVRGDSYFAVPFEVIESFVAEPYLREHPFSPIRGVFGMIFRNKLIPVIDIFVSPFPPKGVVVLRDENKYIGVAFDSLGGEVETDFVPDEKELLSSSYYMGSIEAQGKEVKVVDPRLLDRVYV